MTFLCVVCGWDILRLFVFILSLEYIEKDRIHMPNRVNTIYSHFFSSVFYHCHF